MVFWQERSRLGNLPMEKSAESSLEREERFCIIISPSKAPFNVASHSAPAFPAPPRAASLPRRGQCRGTQPVEAPLPVLRRGVPARGVLRGRAGAAPAGAEGLRMLRHPTLASSQCTSPPRVRPAPRSPRPPARPPPTAARLQVRTPALLGTAGLGNPRSLSLTRIFTLF